MFTRQYDLTKIAVRASAMHRRRRDLFEQDWKRNVKVSFGLGRPGVISELGVPGWASGEEYALRAKLKFSRRRARRFTAPPVTTSCFVCSDCSLQYLPLAQSVELQSPGQGIAPGSDRHLGHTLCKAQIWHFENAGRC